MNFLKIPIVGCQQEIGQTHREGGRWAEACCSLYSREFVKALNLGEVSIVKSTRLEVKRNNLILHEFTGQP